MTEARVRHVDDVRLDAALLLVGKAEPRENARGEVLGNHVGDRDELAQQLLALVGAQVDGDAELLDVVVVERSAEFDSPPVVDVGRRAAQDVPPALLDRVLDADDLRAHRREEARGAGARELSSEVADADSRERAAHRCMPPATM